MLLPIYIEFIVASAVFGFIFGRDAFERLFGEK